MRGKAEKNGGFCPGVGITPAYAGKSAGNNCLFPAQGDHPRVCGEKSQKNLQGQITLGSPPRMRGKAIAARRQPLGLRITPAYAGKSVVPENLDALCKDHPRVCGEKRVRLAFICGIWGSPPRMRGKDKVLEVVPQNTGITPAYAGKSGTVGRSTEHRYPWKLCGIPAAHGCPRVPAAAA